MPGKYTRPLPKLSKAQIKRFWSKVQTGPLDQCWIWTGSVNEHGYGGIRINDQLFKAHRISYHLAKGDPESFCVLHKCDNPPCVNPLHLFKGTMKDNGEDAARKGRTTLGDRNPSRLYPEKHVRGEKTYNAKLNDEHIRELRKQRAESGTSYSKLARQFGVNMTTVWRIVHNKMWKHIK